MPCLGCMLLTLVSPGWRLWPGWTKRLNLWSEGVTYICQQEWPGLPPRPCTHGNGQADHGRGRPPSPCTHGNGQADHGRGSTSITQDHSWDTFLVNGWKCTRCHWQHLWSATNGLADRGVQVFMTGIKKMQEGTIPEKLVVCSFNIGSLHILYNHRSVTSRAADGMSPAFLSI